MLDAIFRQSWSLESQRKFKQGVVGGTFIENNGNALRNGIIDKGSEQFKEKIMDIHHVYVEG